MSDFDDQHDQELDRDLMTDDESVVSEEVANSEIIRFLDTMDVDYDKSHMDDEDRAGFEQAMRVLTKAMADGRLTINEMGEPVFTPKSMESVGAITFHEPTGATFMEMDRRKKNHDVSKMVAIMAGMTKQAPKVFSNMANRDFKVCQAITTLFLG